MSYPLALRLYRTMILEIWLLTPLLVAGGYLLGRWHNRRWRHDRVAAAQRLLTTQGALARTQEPAPEGCLGPRPTHTSRRAPLGTEAAHPEMVAAPADRLAVPVEVIKIEAEMIWLNFSPPHSTTAWSLPHPACRRAGKHHPRDTQPMDYTSIAASSVTSACRRPHLSRCVTPAEWFVARLQPA